jgi:hypothetical protein
VVVVQVWDGASGAQRRVLEDGGRVMCLLAFATADHSPRLASGHTDNSVRLWDPEEGTLLHSLLGHRGLGVRCLHMLVTPERGELGLVSGDTRGGLRLWHVGPAPLPAAHALRAAHKMG